MSLISYILYIIINKMAFQITKLIAQGSQNNHIDLKGSLQTQKYDYNEIEILFPNSRQDQIELKYLIFTSELDIEEFKNTVKNAVLFISVVSAEFECLLFKYHFDLMMELNELKKIGNKIIIKIPFNISIDKLYMFALFKKRLKAKIENINNNFEKIELVIDEIVYDKPSIYKIARINHIQMEDVSKDRIESGTWGLPLIANALTSENENNILIYNRLYEYTIQQMDIVGEIYIEDNTNTSYLNGQHPTKGFFIIGDIENIRGLKFIANGNGSEYIDEILLKLYTKKISNNAMFYSFDGQNNYEDNSPDSYIYSLNLHKIDNFKMIIDVFNIKGIYKIYGLNMNVMCIKNAECIIKYT